MATLPKKRRSHDPHAAPVPPKDVARTVAAALDEDVGAATSRPRWYPRASAGRATVITREAAVVAGRPYVDEVFRQVDPSVRVEWLVADGERVAPAQVLYRLSGPARSLLTGERSALNFLQVLSATATTTRRYADVLAGLPCKVLDTRKTLPGLRNAQKYAVRCGGGVNHRFGLYDGILVKENHIIAAGSIGAAVDGGAGVERRRLVEVEVETLDELREALDAGADMALLDEFTLDDLRDGGGAQPRAPQRPDQARGVGRHHARDDPCGRRDWRRFRLGRLAHEARPRDRPVDAVRVRGLSSRNAFRRAASGVRSGCSSRLRKPTCRREEHPERTLDAPAPERFFGCCGRNSHGACSVHRAPSDASWWRADLAWAWVLHSDVATATPRPARSVGYDAGRSASCNGAANV